MKKTILTSMLCLGLLPIFAQKKWSETSLDGNNIIKNQGGQTLGYSPNSGIKIFRYSTLNKDSENKYLEKIRLIAEDIFKISGKMTVGK